MPLLIVTLLLTTPSHYIVASNNKIQAKLCLLLRFMRFWPHFEETNHVDKSLMASHEQNVKIQPPSTVTCIATSGLEFLIFASCASTCRQCLSCANLVTYMQSRPSHSTHVLPMHDLSLLMSSCRVSEYRPC